MSTRRTFIQQALAGAGAMMLTTASGQSPAPKIQFSLAEWSLHRTIRAGELDHLDFPARARSLGFTAVEYVNGLFGGSRFTFREAGTNKEYLNALRTRSRDADIVNHLLMVDEEGPLALPEDKTRLAAIENHKKWLDAASFLGCRTVRVNLHGEGATDEKKTASVDSLGRLGELAGSMNLQVVVENHGSDSSKGFWLADIMRQVNRSNVGTLPDFGNFCMTHPWGSTQEACQDMYDRYLGVKEMLPFAKGCVSAKSYDFDAHGAQPLIDYKRMMDIIKASGFSGYIGIEFEGFTQKEEDGIRNTRRLLEKYL